MPVPNEIRNNSLYPGPALSAGCLFCSQYLPFDDFSMIEPYRITALSAWSDLSFDLKKLPIDSRLNIC